MTIWLNGKSIAQDTGVSVQDRGFLLGDGVFTTIGVFGGKPFQMAAHLARLRHDADAIGIKIPYTDNELQAAVDGLAKDNMAVRITVSRGPGERGLVPSENSRPTVAITAAPMEISDKDLKLITAKTRRNEGSITSRIKSLNYLDNILARQEAVDAGADDALILNNKGFVTCTTVGNIFVVRNRSLFTPRIEDGVLPGITRQTVMDIAKTQNLAVHEVSILPEQIYEADSLFVTNSLSGPKNVYKIDDVDFVVKNEDSIAHTIRKAWRDQAGL